MSEPKNIDGVAAQMRAQQAAIPSAPPKCPIRYIDFSRYAGMPLRHAIDPILQDIQDKLNEIIDEVNKG